MPSIDGGESSFQDNVCWPGMPFTEKNLDPEQIDDSVNFYLSRIDVAKNQIDSVWYEWGERNTAYWSSKVLPLVREVYPRRCKAGLDSVKLLLERSRSILFLTRQRLRQ